jgi:hypothetical protein
MQCRLWHDQNVTRLELWLDAALWKLPIDRTFARNDLVSFRRVVPSRVMRYGVIATEVTAGNLAASLPDRSEERLGAGQWRFVRAWQEKDPAVIRTNVVEVRKDHEIVALYRTIVASAAVDWLWGNNTVGY